jgi:hypothetical protein
MDSLLKKIQFFLLFVNRLTSKRRLPLLDRRDGETEKEFAARIQGASNKQLLRLSAVEEKVASTFGSKDALVDAIVALKFGKPNPDYKSKLSTFTKAKLLDLHGSFSKTAK